MSDTNVSVEQNSGSAIEQIAMARWQKVQFSNHYMFRLVMDDPELCKRTLEVILGIKIAKFAYQETEKSFEFGPASKGIRWVQLVRKVRRCLTLSII